MTGAWADVVVRLRAERTPAVLVTVTAVRGHAPRAAGAKMVVTATGTHGTVGGGNLEAVAVERARELLAGAADRGPGAAREPDLVEVALSDRAAYQHGVQCCGGDVTLLLEPLPVVPAVAVFGLGHVGLELARILARHDLDLHLVDSRPEQLDPDRLVVLADAVARVQVHEVPVLPELVLAGLPRGSHVLVMTHDHAEDVSLVDAALRMLADDAGRLAGIGLIGSSAKWARFRSRLLADGHPEPLLERVTTPIGLAGDAALAGKEPATIAVSVAAELLRAFEREHAPAAAHEQGRVG